MKISKTTPASSRLLLSLLALVAATSFCLGADQGNGYVFYKEQGFHPDSKAVVKEVVSYEGGATISRAKTKSGKLLEIGSGQSPVFLPDPNGPAASPYAVEQQIQELIPKYPQHQALLEKLLAVCKSKKAEAAAAGSASTKQPEYSVVLLDGRSFPNAKISNITEESFTVTSELSIEHIKYERVDYKLSKLPAGVVKAANYAKALSLEKKLENLIFPKADVRDVTVREMVDFIRMRSKELDPEGKEINITLTAGAAKASETLRLTGNDEDIPLSILLKKIAEGANLKLSVTAEGVVLDLPNG